ncbi:MAG: PAS domain S-box protein, partial [Actinomycetota bacterium]
MKQRRSPERPPGQGAAYDGTERLRAAFEGAPSGIALLDLEGHFLQVNPALCRILGRSERELLQQSWRDVTHPKDRAVQEQYEREALDGGQPDFQWEKRYVRPDGSDTWTLTSRSLVRGEDGSPLY